MEGYDAANRDSVEASSDSAVVSAEAEAKEGCCTKHFQMDQTKAVLKPHSDPKRHDHFRDVICVLIFGVFCLGLSVMFVLVWEHGDVKRLLFPTDYENNLCGVDTNNLTEAGEALRSRGNLAAFPLGSYPRLADDVASVLQGPDCEDITDCKINLLTVCVDSCPAAGDVVCTYEIEEHNPSHEERYSRALQGSSNEAASGCWFTPIDTTEYLGRCVPWPKKTQGETFECFEYREANGVEVKEAVFSGPEMCTKQGDDPDELTNPDVQACGAIVGSSGWGGNSTVNRALCESANRGVNRSGCVYTPPDGRPPVGLRKTDCAGELKVATLTVEETTGGGDVLMKMLVSYTYMLQQYMEDVITVRWFIIFCGAVVSLLQGVLFIVLMQLFAPCLVWLVVIGIFLLLTVGDAFMILKSGSFFWIDVSNVTQAVHSTTMEMAAEAELTGPENVNAFQDPAEEGEYLIFWTVGGHVGFVMWAVYFVGMCCMREKIALCVTIIKNSSEYIGRVPGILAVPFFTYTAQLLSMAFFAFFIMIIRTCGSFTVSDLGAAATAVGTDECGCDASNTACHEMCVQDAIAGERTGVIAEQDPSAAADAAEDDDLIFYMMWLAVIAFFWVSNLFAAIGTITMSRAVADNYWHDPEADEPLSLSPTLSALKGTLVYHLGSAIFGALVIAIVNLVRAILQYIGHQTKELQERNKLLKVAFLACACALWCFEKVVKYLTRNAYIFIAITGEGFLQSAWNAFTVVLKNPLRVAIVQPIAFIILLLGKTFVTLGTTGFCWHVLTTHEEYLPGGSSEVSDPRLPCACVALMSFIVANAFMDAFGVTTDTLLLSFCFDEQLQKEEADQGYVLYATRNGSTLGAFAKSVDSQGQDDDDEEEEAEEAEGGEKVAESDVDPRP